MPSSASDRRPTSKGDACGGARGKRTGPDARKTDAGVRRGSAYLRSQNEDDDGYDPFSDRPAPPEPLFQRDPWD